MTRARHRSFALFAIAGFAALLPTQQSLCLVRFGQDDALRDLLIANGAVYADLGARVVARLSPELDTSRP
jgi:hypothetical protein